MTETRLIDSIEVGDRIRKDLGDLDKLAQSIDENGGLLQPIVIRSNGELIAGERRLEACRKLGRTQIEVYVRDDLDGAIERVVAERDENTCREGFTPEEAVRMADRLTELLAPAAEERRREKGREAALRQHHGEGRENFSQPSHQRTRERVAPAVGMSHPTLGRARTVVREADSGNPVAQEALTEMNKTGKVTPAYNKVRRAKKAKPDPEKPAPFEITNERSRQLANASKLRVEKAVGTAAGITRGFPHLHLDRAVAASTPEEIDGWLSVFGESVKAIRRVKRELEDIR